MEGTLLKSLVADAKLDKATCPSAYIATHMLFTCEQIWPRFSARAR